MSHLSKIKSSLSTLSIALLIAIFPLIFGIAFLSFSGPTELACERSDNSLVTCLLTKKAAFGSIDSDQISINPLIEVRIDKQVKESVESTPDGITSSTWTPIYGVMLVGNENNENIVLYGYSYSYKRQQKIVKQIDNFLNNSNESSLVWRKTNYLSYVMSLGALGLAVIILIRGIIVSVARM